jgi:parallel beta helix pectate lyase-like protein
MSSLWGCGLALGLASMLITPATAKTWHVSANHTGDAPTIQAAIDSCQSADTVLVAPGAYYENISLLGKNIWVHSASGPEATFITSSNDMESVVRCIGGEPPDCILEGFTITGGKGHENYGGGIYIYNSSPRIRHNIIRQNQAQLGGGVCVNGDQSFPFLEDNTIADNNAALGGGLYVHFSEIDVTNNNFLNNKATARGGGICMYPVLGSPIISHNRIQGNEAVIGGGAYIEGSDEAVTVTYNLFAGNKASGDPYYGAGGGATFLYVKPMITNNTFSQNQGPSGLQRGGALCLISIYYPGEFTHNIITQSVSGAVACLHGCPCPIKYSNNMLWSNVGGDFVGCANPDSTFVNADPQFCDPASGNYSVSSTSPALGPTGPIGAFPEPGCGPVPTRSSTWGSLKSRIWKN